MHANKAAYHKAREEFEIFIGQLIGEINRFDPSVSGLLPKKLIFRLNRDIRFGKDKSPYHTAFRAHISPGGRFPIPVGYYLHIQPDNCFLGGGVHADNLPGAIKMVRDAIADQAAAFESIVNDPAFANEFKVTGTKLKNVPKDYDKDHTLAEYLKHKSWDIEYHFPDEILCGSGSGSLTGFCAEKFRLMKPFNDFLNNALKDFTWPERS